MSPATKQNDGKLPFAIAGGILVIAAGIAILASLGQDSEPGPSTPTAIPAVRTAAVEPAVLPAAGGTKPVQESSSLADLVEHTEAAAESFVVDPSADFVQQGIAAYESNNFERAVAYFQAEAEARPDRAWTHYLLALSLWKSGDADAAAVEMRRSIFGSSGQRCLAGSVVVGVGDAHSSIRERMLDSAASIRMGDGLDEATDMGPVISAAHRDRVTSFIDQGEADGARLSLDGRGATVPGMEGGYWVGPTVFEDVAPDISIGTEEIFGPVATINRATDIDEAIAMMHGSRYGNACSIFTTSGYAARDFRYRAGISMIGVNIGVAAPMAFFPFGGSRGSFFGDLKAQGKDAISFFTDQRVVISRW